jgi:hypothetical protein
MMKKHGFDSLKKIYLNTAVVYGAFSKVNMNQMSAFLFNLKFYSACLGCILVELVMARSHIHTR